MGLGFCRIRIRRAGDRAGSSTFVVDTDLAFDPGLVEGCPDYGCDEGYSDRDADRGARQWGHVDRAFS